MAQRRTSNWPLIAVVLSLVLFLLGGGAAVWWYLNGERRNAAPVARPDGPPPVQPPPTFPPTGQPAPARPAEFRPLVEVPGADPLPTTGPVDPITYFAAPPFETPKNSPPATGLLVRELYRQGVLLAAREELGLTARDAVLGDLPPDDLPDGNRLRVTVRSAEGGQSREVAVAAGAGDGKPVWSATSPPIPRTETPLEALKQAEEFARRGYVTALKRAGLTGKANPTDPAAAVPPEVARLLERMSFTAQFDAVRRLHALVREKGESAATLGALSRGYAHLGLLTDRQWGGHTWVFKARSLLYAERLRNRDEASPWGWWHRGYALALAGAPTFALADLSVADARRAAVEPPTWATLAGHLCRFDSAELRAAADDKQYGDTAKLFEFLTVESYQSPARTLRVGGEVLRRAPDCYRVHDSLATVGGVSAQHVTTAAGWEVFDDTFGDRVAELAGVPKAAADLAKRGDSEPELVEALRAAGRSRDDRGGVSWATLAGFAREARFVQANGRLHFMRYVWGVPAGEEVRRVRPLVADHPLYPFLETYLIDPARDPVGYRRRVLATQPPELSYRHRDLLDATERLGGDDWQPYLYAAVCHGEFLYTDTQLYLRAFNETGRFMKLDPRTFFGHHPNAPLVRAHVAREVGVTAEQAKEWADKSQHPEPLVILGRQATATKKWAEAERLLKRACELSPEDAEAPACLASVYRASGQDEKWLAAMEDSLKQPDVGLNHARVRVDVAKFYMAKKEFEKAWPYAEAAADTWAYWAMTCASECAEGKADLATAELWLRRAAERYPDSFHVWYFWCVRTGEGDRQAARKLFEGAARDLGESRTVDLYRVVTYRLIDGQKEKAIALLEKANGLEKGAFYPLLTAVLFDSLGDRASRDRVLDAVGKNEAASVMFAELSKQLRAETAPTVEEVVRIGKSVKANEQVNTAYILGHLLLNRKEPKRAAELFKRLTKLTSQPDAMAPVLAGQALQEMGER